MESIHDYRLFGFSIVDVLGTLVIAAIIAHYYKIESPWGIFLSLLLLSIPVHIAFKVQTHGLDVLGLCKQS